jgi:hypothetical protein
VLYIFEVTGNFYMYFYKLQIDCPKINQSLTINKKQHSNLKNLPANGKFGLSVWDFNKCGRRDWAFCLRKRHRTCHYAVHIVARPWLMFLFGSSAASG